MTKLYVKILKKRRNNEFMKILWVVKFFNFLEKNDVTKMQNMSYFSNFDKVCKAFKRTQVSEKIMFSALLFSSH